MLLANENSSNQGDKLIQYSIMAADEGKHVTHSSREFTRMLMMHACTARGALHHAHHRTAGARGRTPPRSHGASDCVLDPRIRLHFENFQSILENLSRGDRLATLRTGLIA
eukprot:COSAG02_NODE_659_length_18772_cov_14.955015_17_plen_111_part_00